MTYLTREDVGRRVRIVGTPFDGLLGTLTGLEAQINGRRQWIAVTLDKYPQPSGTAFLRSEFVFTE